VTAPGTAHLVHGFLGAGKTTFARALEARLPAVRFTHDEWMVALYGRDPPAADFPELARRVHAVLEPLWTRCLALGLDVVLDFAFWSRAERDETRRRIEALGGRHRLYLLAAPDEEAWARIERRNAEPGALFIARATFEALRARFEPLGADEEREVATGCVEAGPD
jgi:predicted kinase